MSPCSSGSCPTGLACTPLWTTTLQACLPASVGLGKVQLRDFAYELAKRGFVTLAIGSPGGDAWKPPQVQCQPLSFLAYVSANCASALAALSEVDPKRIGIVGHSYGGKWAMFSMALSQFSLSLGASTEGKVGGYG